jgi:hypothetical protein
MPVDVDKPLVKLVKRGETTGISNKEVRYGKTGTYLFLLLVEGQRLDNPQHGRIDGMVRVIINDITY